MPESQTRDTIVRLLSSLGSNKEIQQYLKRFSRVDQHQFAVVKVGGAVMQDSMQDLASALGFLQRVGLTPIVIHGAGPQLNERLAEAGIESQFEDNLRVTPPAVLAIARQVMLELNLQLVEMLQSQDVRATSISGGVFEAELLDIERYNLVGKVVGVNLAGVDTALNVRSIPVLTCLGETAGGQIVNINADMAANELVRKVQPFKIVFLTGTGGLLDDKNQIISSVNLRTEFDELISEPWIHSGMALKLRQIADLLTDLPSSSSVSITRPTDLAKELFTHKGAGTLIRRGERIERFDSWQQVDTLRIRELVESGFGRTLDANYFKNTTPLAIHVSEDYRAIAVITEELGCAHLDKFAVAESARGEGLGKAVWQAMRKEHEQLFWRARRANMINQFYFQESDGCVKSGDWTVFWYGMTSFSKIEACVAFAAQQPATI